MTTSTSMPRKRCSGPDTATINALTHAAMKARRARRWLIGLVGRNSKPGSLSWYGNRESLFMHDTKDIQGTEPITERRAMLAGIGAIVLWGALATLSVIGRPHPGLPDGRHDIRHRRGTRHRAGALARPAVARPDALAGAGLAARRRRPVRLSRALFRGPAARAARRGEPHQLPLAVADRAAVGAARRRASGLAASRGRPAGFRGRRAAGLRARPRFRRRHCAGLCAGAGLRLRLVALFGTVAPLRRDPDRCDRGLLHRRGAPLAGLPSAVRAHGVARVARRLARRAGARHRPDRRRLLSLGSCREARRHPRAGGAELRRTHPVDRPAHSLRARASRPARC